MDQSLALLSPREGLRSPQPRPKARTVVQGAVCFHCCTATPERSGMLHSVRFMIDALNGYRETLQETRQTGNDRAQMRVLHHV